MCPQPNFLDYDDLLKFFEKLLVSAFSANLKLLHWTAEKKTNKQTNNQTNKQLQVKNALPTYLTALKDFDSGLPFAHGTLKVT